jgi:hypothetical protein
MRSLKYILLVSWLLNGVVAYTQPNRNYETNPDRKRTNIWYFGQLAGIDFNTNPPTNVTYSKIYALEGSASICDTSGQLLFYTNGITVWNKNHDTMEGGFDLMGDMSSAQSALIVKNYDNDSIYYILTTPNALDYTRGMRFNEVNIKLNNGLGMITKKNIILHSTSAEKSTAVNHQNNKDIWIIGHSFIDNIFFSYLVKPDGIISCPVLSPVGSTLDNLGAFKGNAQFYLKASHNSQYISNCIPYSKKIEVFNFSQVNGDLTMFKTINLGFMPYGIDYSTDDQNLFITGILSDTAYVGVHNIKKGTTRIFKKFLKTDIESIQFKNDIIYLAIKDSLSLKAIDFINNYSLADLNSSKDFMLSPFPRKSTHGLPNFNQSYFYTPSVDFSYNYDCANNIVDFYGRDTFKADSYAWQFKDLSGVVGSGFSFKKDAVNIGFVHPAEYEIRFIAKKGSRSDTIIKLITIYSKINKNFLGRDTAYEIGTSFSKTLKAPLGMYCYLWSADSSQGVSYVADTTGVFICKVTSQSFCVVTDTIVISACINDLAIPSIFRSRDTLYTSHLTADSFVWYRNNSFYKVTKSPFLILTDTGLYQVEAAKKGHCNQSSKSQYVNKLDIHSISLQDGIKLYPNPAKDHIMIEFDNPDIYHVIIYDALGQKTYDCSTNTNITINLNHFPIGVYLVQITNATLQQLNTKILKE